MSFPFHIGLGQILCLGTLFAVTLFELWASRARSGGPERVCVDRKTGPVMLLMAVAGLGGGFVLSSEARAFWRDPFVLWQYLGFSLAGAGLLVRFVAIRSLGDAFSIHPGVSRSQTLCTLGIYRLIRHPAYLGTLLLFGSMAWIYAHPLSSSIVFLLPALGLIYRIRVEESILERVFGEEYLGYKQRTKRFIPYVY